MAKVGKAKRRLLPPAPLPRRGVWGEGNVGRRSPFTQSTKKPSLSWLGEFSCGVVNKSLTNFEDLIAVYLFGIQIPAIASQHEIL
jgi:hypothetical protein